jgi:hypothetical protein
MPQPITYQDIWIRFVHFTWQNQDGWRTDIRPRVLNGEKIKHALFVLDDRNCVFIPLEELRRTLFQKSPNKNGSIIFNVNPHLKTIDGKRVKMNVVRPQDRKSQREFLENLLEGMT